MSNPQPTEEQASVRRATTAPTRHEAVEVYEIVAAEGEAELARPTSSIVWSGFAAGLAISFSLIGEAALRARLPEADWRPVVENLGYSAGFLLVIIARLQLFTENTITAVLPMLKDPCRRTVFGTARLWGVSLGANLTGAAIASALIVHGGVTPPDITAAALEVSRHVAEMTTLEAFARALPAGFLIAAIVWMLPSAEGSEFWVILAFTYLIALGDFAHVVVGSVELFALVWAGEAALAPLVVSDLLPALAGNIIGGTGLFALLAWAQVREEMGGPPRGDAG